jgi:hypothetical protein
MFLMYRIREFVVLMYIRNALQHRTGASEGPEPPEVEGTGRMRETGAPSTEEVAMLSGVCAPHRG